jgi:hypothetical protein
MYVLMLNDMRRPKIEMLEPVARAHTKEALERHLSSHLTTPYMDDGRWRKVFTKGSSLEWFNEPYGPESYVHVGTEEDYLSRAREEYRSKVLSIPEVSAW